MLFHQLSKLYKHTSVMITTNLTLAEWGSVLTDTKMTTALLDRLTRHPHTVETGNDSYRFRHSGASAKSRIEPREQTKRGGTTPNHPLTPTTVTLVQRRSLSGAAFFPGQYSTGTPGQNSTGINTPGTSKGTREMPVNGWASCRRRRPQDSVPTVSYCVSTRMRSSRCSNA